MWAMFSMGRPKREKRRIEEMKEELEGKGKKKIKSEHRKYALLLNLGIRKSSTKNMEK